MHARDEVEAESVAYTVLKRLDAAVQMGDYILGHLGPGEQVPEGIALNLMLKASENVITMGKGRISANQLVKKPRN